MFKSADPSRRIPVWLQARTKENIIWQLKMLVLFLCGMQVKYWYEERELRKTRERYTQQNTK